MIVNKLSAKIILFTLVVEGNDKYYSVYFSNNSFNFWKIAIEACWPLTWLWCSQYSLSRLLCLRIGIYVIGLRTEEDDFRALRHTAEKERSFESAIASGQRVD